MSIDSNIKVDQESDGYQILITEDMVGKVLNITFEDHTANDPPPRVLPWSRQDIWEGVEEFLPHLHDSMATLNSGAFYAGSYTALAYRSLYIATHDERYWDRFQDFFDIVRHNASVEVQVDSPTSVCGTGGPRSQYGAAHATYYQWPNCPHVKSQRQWAMTVMHFLHWIVGHGDDAKRTWAINAWKWVSTNIVERWMTNYGDLGVNSIVMARAARDQEYQSTLRSGYWGSQVALVMCTATIDDDIRWSVGGISVPLWQEYQRSAGHEPIQEWVEWWKGATEFQIPDGAILWDHTNPNINEHGAGWGLNNEHPMPATGHAGRYIYLQQLLYDTGQSDDSILRGLARTTERICLPLDYVTPDGDHQGKIAGVQQFANYIDGDNSAFRLGMRGMRNQAGSNASMEGFMYPAWYLGGVYSERVFDALLNMHAQVTGPTIPASDSRHTGSYSRHVSSYGIVGMWAAVLDVNRRRQENRRRVSGK